jgi:acetyl-CoA acetyltransferase
MRVATDFHVSREDQDALATESHRPAAAATAAGYFKEQIVPVEIPARGARSPSSTPTSTSGPTPPVSSQRPSAWSWASAWIAA